MIKKDRKILNRIFSFVSSSWKALIILALELGVIISGVVFFFVKWPNEFGFCQLQEHIAKSPLLAILFGIFSFCLFLLLIWFLWSIHYSKIPFRRTIDYWEGFGFSIIYALVAVMLILILSKSLIIFNSGYYQVKKDDAIIQIIGLLLMFITVLLTVGSFLIYRRMQIVDRLGEYTKELREAMGISANIVLSSLPPFGITINIPNRSMHILEEINNLILKNPYLKDYIEDKKNVDTGPKIQFAQAIYRYGGMDSKCIEIFKEQVIKRTIDREVLFQAKLRLGITYKQFGKYDEAYSLFEELEEETRVYPYYNTFAQIGLGFTRYAEYMEKVKFNSGVWGSPEGQLDNEIKKILIEAFNYFRKLWDSRENNPFNGIPYISDYLAKIAYDIKSIVEWENAGFENKEEIDDLIKTAVRSTINGISIIVPKNTSDWEIHIVPFLDDYAFLADYYLSFAINCHFLVELNEEKEKMEKLRNIAHEKSIKYAMMVRDIYPPWAFITSERQLKIVKGEDFLSEIINLFDRQPQNRE